MKKIWSKKVERECEIEGEKREERENIGENSPSCEGLGEEIQLHSWASILIFIHKKKNLPYNLAGWPL